MARPIMIKRNKELILSLVRRAKLDLIRNGRTTIPRTSLKHNQRLMFWYEEGGSAALTILASL